MARLEIIESGLFSPCPVCKSEIEPEFDTFGPTGKLPTVGYRLDFLDTIDDSGQVSKSNWQKRNDKQNAVAVCCNKCAVAVKESWKKFPEKAAALRKQIEGK